MPRASQKVLCNLIKDHGGIDKLCNKTNVSQQSQHLSKLLDLHTDLFGNCGDTRHQKSWRLINYWYTNYYKTGTYSSILKKFGAKPSAEIIVDTWSASKAEKEASSENTENIFESSKPATSTAPDSVKSLPSVQAQSPVRKSAPASTSVPNLSFAHAPSPPILNFQKSSLSHR